MARRQGVTVDRAPGFVGSRGATLFLNVPQFAEQLRREGRTLFLESSSKQGTLNKAE
jgi:hypothetical protein